MSFFKKLFKKKPKKEKAKKEPKKETPWFNNAPEDWLPFTSSEAGPSMSPLDRLVFIASFTKMFEQNEKSLSILGMVTDILLEDGMLTVPIHISVDEIEYYIMVYPLPPQEAADHYQLLSKLHKSGKIPKPLWFAPFELPTPQGSAQLDMLTFRSFAAVKNEEAPKGHYAIWWETDEDTSFTDSPICEQLDAIYTISQDYYTYIMAMILLRVLNMENASRTALPEHFSVPVVLPNNIHAIICASQEKGIQLMFHKDTTSIKDACLVLKHYRKMIELLAQETQKKGAPKDPASDKEGETPLQWWKMLHTTIKTLQEKGENTQVVGTLIIGEND